MEVMGLRLLLWCVFLLSCVALPGESEQETSFGDIVECIDKAKQPAFDNPLLKYHKLQESPSEIPRVIETQKGRRQTWEAQVSTAVCPEGTVPIRLGNANNVTLPEAKNYHPGHEYAIVSSSTDSPVELYGTRAIINVWDPAIEGAEEMSVSQLWIASGKYETGDLNTIEVGWEVQPKVYKDNRPRLFLLWTGNAYKTACRDVRCPGFIQTSTTIVIGGPISPISSLGGNQFETSILVWKDRKSGNWWLSLGFNKIVGYWPSELFTTLVDHAQYIQWGGEIFNAQQFGRHTTTEMGSGHFSDEGFGRSSYIRNLEIVDNSNSLQSIPIQKLIRITTNPECYNVDALYTEEWKTHIFYGGPGCRFTHSGAVSMSLGLPSICLFVAFFLII